MAQIHANLNSNEKMKHLHILKMYQLNLYKMLSMFQVKFEVLNQPKLTFCFLRCLVIRPFGVLRASSSSILCTIQ